MTTLILLVAFLVFGRGDGGGGYRVESQTGENYRWAYVVGPDGTTAFGIEKVFPGQGVGWKAECWKTAELARSRVAGLTGLDYADFMREIDDGVPSDAIGPAIECGDEISRRLLKELGVLGP